MKHIQIDEDDVVQFSYTNHKGEVELRKVSVDNFGYGQYPFHQGNVWVLNGWCMSRKSQRTFELSRMDMDTFVILQKA